MYRISGSTLKKALLKNRSYKCEKCNRDDWDGVPIPLQVHHIDGNNTNNSNDNLLLLCANCHALTSNFAIQKSAVLDEELAAALQENSTIHAALIDVGLSTCGVQYAKAKRIIKEYGIVMPLSPVIPSYTDNISFCQCGKQKHFQAELCLDCHKQTIFMNSKRPKNRNEFKKEIRNIPFTELGRKYDVSDTAIKKWCKTYLLPYTKKEINKYSDEDWEKL